MTTNDSHPHGDEHVIETCLRNALTDPAKKQAVLAATGWDASMPSKVMAGGVGITLDKLDALCAVLKITFLEIDDVIYLQKGNSIGANCCRRLISRTHCGPRPV